MQLIGKIAKYQVKGFNLQKLREAKKKSGGKLELIEHFIIKLWRLAGGVSGRVAWTPRTGSCRYVRLVWYSRRGCVFANRVFIVVFLRYFYVFIFCFLLRLSIDELEKRTLR